MKSNNLEILNKLVGSNISRWEDDFNFRESNKKWLADSARVAMRVLRALKEQHLNQKDLAERMNVTPQQVSKLLKGKENVSFETVHKIQDALNIKLMDILGGESKVAEVTVLEKTVYKTVFIASNITHDGVNELTGKSLPIQRQRYDIAGNTFGNCIQGEA